jgi:putative nucleotidyltransferase with HDIG domain
MWDYLTRQQLQRKGLSCGRKRREQSQSEWVETLRCSPFIRFFILCFFLAGLGTLVKFLPAGNTYQTMQASGNMGTVALLSVLAVSAVHFRIEYPLLWARNSRVLLVYLVLLLQLALVQVADLVLHINGHPMDLVLLCAPHALAPVTLTLLLGVQAGFFAAIYCTLLGGMLVPEASSLPFCVMSLGVGLVGVLTTRKLRKRSQLMRAGIWIALTGLVLALVLGKMGPPSDLIHGRSWDKFGLAALILLISGIATVTCVSGLLPVLEGVFRITTTISWIELSDLNHQLLRRMTLEAPGTYHHSLMVASLAENAAEAIGANPTQCRVCAYFHDIGKLAKPQYCIENISGDENPHDDLPPSMSSLIIISHVKEGVDLALKHKLNREIIDVIQQHHGNSLVYFFYRRALDNQQEMKELVKAGKASPTDVPEVAEKEFRYPGPKPQSAENAIVSLADAIESASRVLVKPTPAKIEQMVDEIVANRIKDGQLDECDLTLSELDRIKESFANSLRTMLHRRIPYPDEKGKEKDKETDSTDGSKPPLAKDPPSDREREKERQRAAAKERQAKFLL